MKLFNLRLTTLKSKLYAIVFVSFVVRVVAFFALPSTASSMAPDEGNYGELTEWIGHGIPANHYEYAHLYEMSRSLIVPASLLYRIGIDGVTSVRLISLLYGVLTLILIVQIALRMEKSQRLSLEFVEKNTWLLPLLFGVFSFTPSHLLWSVLGLRESATEFWTLLALANLYLITHGKVKNLTLSLTTIFLSIIFTFSSRPQVGWILLLTIFVSIIKIIKSRNGILILLTLSLSLPIVTNIQSTDASIQSRQKGSNFLEQQIINHNYHNEVNRENAASEIPEIKCSFDGPRSYQLLACLIWRTPYAVFTFLFRPMIIQDITSRSSFFAALENLVWLLIMFYVIFMLIRNRRLAFLEQLTPSLLFGVIYSVAAGTYEGNMGTAFRHKSLILWVVILLLASTIVATQQRRAEQQGISGSSQE